MSFNAQLYDEITIQTSYIGNAGLAQMPAAGPPGTPCSIVRTASPWGQKVVVWRIKKTGGMPALPHPDTGNANEVLAGYQIKPATPALMADGVTKCVMVEGSYTYFLKTPPWPGVDTFAMGTMPIDGTPGALHVIRPEDFDRTILAGDGRQPLPSTLPTIIP